MRGVLGLLLLPAVLPADELAYAQLAGEPVGVYQSGELNFRLDLASEPYVFVDFTKQNPDAAFAAMRTGPMAFTMVIVEDLGIAMDARQYAEIARIATVARITSGADSAGSVNGVSTLGEVRRDGLIGQQVGIEAEVDGIDMSYVITGLTNGTTAYQLITFGLGASIDAVKQEADVAFNGFSLQGNAATVPKQVKSVGNYESSAFAYRFRADSSDWFPWADLEDDYSYADIGALSARGYGAVVMPMCWQGERPTQLALLDVFLEQYGEDYPTPFIEIEADARKGGATGVYLYGSEASDDVDFGYHFWVVANEHCAYSLGTWGPEDDGKTKAGLARVWEQFEILDNARVFEEQATAAERTRNAFFLNQLGMHYYEARSYREAFRYLSQATDLDTTDTVYVTNAVRVLTEIEAFSEAYEWLGPRIAAYGDDSDVRSWDAWLSYQVGDIDKAVEHYGQLFREGYREDDEFSLYIGLLADRDDWDQLHRAFDDYRQHGMNDAMYQLEATLMRRRGEYGEALAVLDGLTKDRPFNADLVYSKIEVYDQMGEMAEVLRLADLLIEKKYESLESYFYKGYAEFQQKSYLKSRESFETAKRYSPTNTVVQEYLDAIDGILGEGDNAGIRDELAAVPLPGVLQAVFQNADYGRTLDGYGALFLSRMTGYDFDRGNHITKTWYQQIKIQDAQGIEQFSTLEFNFDPAFEQFYPNSIIVRDASGEIIAEGDRDAYYVTDTVDGYEASTEKTVHLPVPSLSPGVVIEVVVTKNIGVGPGEFPLDISYLSSNRPIGYSALFVTGDHQSLSYDSFAIDEPVTSENSLIWQVSNPVVYRWEPLQPYFDRLLPWVYLGTASNDWKKAGADYLAEIHDKLDTSLVEDTAKRVVRGIDDDARKIEVISRYVQKELHYEAIEFGRRAFIPKSARETLRDRYGDCKDHAVLLYAMLNAVDIPAELALVNINQKVRPDLPNVDQFDHMIVSAPLGDSRLFIDATDKDLNLATTPPRFLAGNYALVLSENSELVPIPDFTLGESAISIEREIERVGENQLRIIEIGIFSGYQAAELRSQLRDIESSEMLGTMQRWVADRYSDAIVDDAFIDNVFEADNELVIELQYRLPLDVAESFKLPSFIEANYLDHGWQADRRFVFELDVPLSVSSVTTVLQSGNNLTVATKKAEADESRFGQWRRQIEKGDDSWVFSLDYTSVQSQFGASEYEEFAEFHRRLVGSIEQPVVLQ